MLLFAMAPLRAAEIANLSNGFSIRNERHEVVGSVTRLYTGSDATSYIDVPTAEVSSFEPALADPPSLTLQNRLT